MRESSSVDPRCDTNSIGQRTKEIFPYDQGELQIAALRYFVFLGSGLAVACLWGSDLPLMGKTILTGVVVMALRFWMKRIKEGLARHRSFQRQGLVLYPNQIEVPSGAEEPRRIHRNEIFRVIIDEEKLSLELELKDGSRFEVPPIFGRASLYDLGQRIRRWCEEG
ncbi:MAG: hypothetical protein NZM37_05590 [Sandaracinaceae bacterium]|nr:hypothetical protein [Sandaracinaceae bacterium]MDW8246969.1 hypothetical protein [Sandaracinaceae bacterium]